MHNGNAVYNKRYWFDSNSSHMKILLQKPVKFIISKAHKTLGRSTLKNPEKVKEIVRRIIKTEEFQDSKVIF